MEGEAHKYRDIKNLTMASSTNKRLRPDSDDDDNNASTIFTTQENFAIFLIIESKNKEKTITSLSPFVIEKQIEAIIGTAKSVKKLKKQTLLVETTRKGQTENLKKINSLIYLLKFRNTQHSTLQKGSSETLFSNWKQKRTSLSTYKARVLLM